MLGVVERRRCLSFLKEPLLGRLVAGQVRRQQLDRHRPLEAWVCGRVDDAHPAATQLRDDLIRAEGGAGSEDHARLDYSRVWRIPSTLRVATSRGSTGPGG